MIRFIKRLWAAAPFATLVLAAALAATAVFGVRAVRYSIYWSDPAHREQPIAGWMTPGYVAQSWAVPREVVLEALDAPQPPPRGPMNLYELAEFNNTTVDALVDAAEQAVEEWRAAHPKPDGLK